MNVHTKIMLILLSIEMDNTLLEFFGKGIVPVYSIIAEWLWAKGIP